MDTLLEMAPCGVLSVADDGTILTANATFRALVEADALVGQPVNTVLGPGARIFYQTHVFPLLRVEGKAEEIYLSLRTSSGEEVPVLLNAVRRERDVHPVSDIVVVPMRRRNQFESELLQAKRAAEEANRARSRFLSILSHDLRAPLSAINMAATILASGSGGPVTPAQRHDLERIGEASRYVLDLVTDLLTFSRIEAQRVSVRMQALSVASVLDRAENLVEHLVIEAGLSIIRDAAARIDPIMADPARLQQVLLNLITNAVKFTPAGGRVTLATEQDGGTIRLHVRDTGRGIDADALPHVFEPFVQLEEADALGGVGLGLAISRELVRAMGGDLTVVSTLGVGTTFTVALPIATLNQTDPVSSA